MNIEIRLVNGCLNCDKPIPMEFMLCSIPCMNELNKCAAKQGVRADFNKEDVWSKPEDTA